MLHQGKRLFRGVEEHNPDKKNACFNRCLFIASKSLLASSEILIMTKITFSDSVLYISFAVGETDRRYILGSTVQFTESNITLGQFGNEIYWSLFHTSSNSSQSGKSKLVINLNQNSGIPVVTGACRLFPCFSWNATMTKAIVHLNSANVSAGTFRLDISRNSYLIRSWIFEIRGCTCTSNGAPLQSNSTSLDSIGVYYCNDGHLVSQGETPSIKRDNVSTKCLANASWTDCGLYECWSAPQVEMKINGTQRQNLSANAGDPFNITCTILSDGYPDGGTAHLYLNGSEWTERVLTLSKTHNGNDVTCVGINKFTTLAKDNDADLLLNASTFVKLHVNFGPSEISTSLQCKVLNATAETFNATLMISFSSNPDHGDLTVFGGGKEKLTNTSSERGEFSCCNVRRQRFRLLFVNVEANDTVRIVYQHNQRNYTILDNLDLGRNCSRHVITTTEGMTILSRGLENEASQNPAFDESSAIENVHRSEHEECRNVLYGTTDDLKSNCTSGGNSGEVVDNVLYGTASGVHAASEVYSTVVKPNKKKEGTSDADGELYTTVQKPKKTKDTGKTNKDGPSTSVLQNDDVYTEVNKVRKKKKDGKRDSNGQENQGFSSGLQQDATYTAVGKKERAKKRKGKKSDDGPGASGMIPAETTYAVINKNDEKSEKDSSDEDALHGSNKD